MYSSWSYGKTEICGIGMISASHLAPTVHIIVVILSKYIQRVQFDEKEYYLYW